MKTKNLKILVAAIGLAAVAGCSSTHTSAAKSAPSQSSTTVAVRDIGGVGATLVDGSGDTLYFADQETGGSIRCLDACLRFWRPLTVASGATPTASAALGGALATINRPDGSTQVTYDGHALYTFTDDGGPGHADGNGFTDTFDGTTFNWHASTSTGAAPATTPSTDGYGY